LGDGRSVELNKFKALKTLGVVRETTMIPEATKNIQEEV
jgi:hypothetical protein